MSGYEPAHTMTDYNHTLRIELQSGIAGHLSNPVQRRGSILKAMLEAKIAWTTPRPAIMNGQHIPSSPPHRLCEIHILLVSRQTVEEQHGGMGARASRRIEDRVEVHTTARDRLGQRMRR